MNAPELIIPAPLALGSLLPNGDRYFARIRGPEGDYGVALPPIALRAHPAAPWNNHSKRVDGAMSYYDGLSNTVAMAKAGSKVAEFALDKGLYIPARDELEPAYRTLKPSTDENWCYRNGDNPSSIPAGYPYTETDPAQTTIGGYRTGEPEALPEAWVWTSTQYARDDAYAWVQHFSDGSQYFILKSNDFEVVLVRRFPIR
jgi:hypothetical protein